jgi:exodeoxyribonuclease III
MKITSWNVNSINVRLENVKRYLDEYKPDILMMQELKTLDFPEMEFTAMGYHGYAATQKTYNGVATVSKNPLEIIHDKLPGFEDDPQARYLEGKLEGVTYINIYLPNGNPLGTEKFDYKCAWMEHLITRLTTLRRKGEPFVIGGDFNIIPEDGDCYDPKAWLGDALFQPQSRQAYRRMINIGLTDALRAVTKSAGLYTFWDYQAGAWQQNKGIRIDHFLLSPEMADRLEGCAIHKEPRGWEKPSDHTPIEVTLA